MEMLDNDMTMEKRMAQRAMLLRTPLNGSLELLPLCNMNCDMCYVRLDPKTAQSVGGIRSLEEWTDLAQQLSRAGVLFLLLTGGEPLLYPHFKELYLKLQEMGFILTVNTNGTLIDEAWADFFAEHKPRRVNISLYGSSDAIYQKLCHYEHGYTRTVHAIQLLRERGVDVRMGCTITKANRDCIRQIYELSRQLGTAVDFEVYLMPASRERGKSFDFQTRLAPEDAAAALREINLMTRSPENYREYINDIVRTADRNPFSENPVNGISCMAGRCGFTVNWTGKLRPCVMLNAPEIDVFENGFDASWKYLTEHCNQVDTCKECAVCNKRHICRTCAAAELYEEGSHGQKPEYLCEFSDELLKLYRADAENAL